MRLNDRWEGKYFLNFREREKASQNEDTSQAEENLCVALFNPTSIFNQELKIHVKPDSF